MADPIRIRPVHIRDAKRRVIFSWSGPVTTAGSRNTAVAHAEAAWTAATAATGREGKMPKGRVSLGFMSNKDLSSLTTWKPGRAFREALDDLPVTAGAASLGHLDFDAIALGLLASDPELLLPKANGDYAYLGGYIENVRATSQTLIASQGCHHGGHSLRAHPDTALAILAIATGMWAAGAHPKGEAHLRGGHSATINAAALAKARDAAPAGCGIAADALALLKLPELSARIRERTR